MVSFETMFFTVFAFSAVNTLVTILGMAVVLKRIGEISVGDHTSTWFTIEKCEVVLVPEEDDRKVEP